MPATLYTVELAPVFIARGSGDDIDQDIRGDVRLAHNAPQGVIPLQKWPRCVVEKIFTQCESSACGRSRTKYVARTHIGFHGTRTLRKRDYWVRQRGTRDGLCGRNRAPSHSFSKWIFRVTQFSAALLVP
jgi:hypothetical protein